METARKVLILALCAVLLISATVMGTLAYLTATTSQVKNTFTVGNVSFADSALDEADVNEYGVKETENRVLTNNYKLVPGHSYTKDPTVHMSKDTEDCWLFVKVVNGISDIEAESTTTTIAAQMKALGWTPVAEGSNIYAYKQVAKAGDNIVVFNNFTLADDATVTGYENATITIEAYAVQADGLDTAAEAWAKAPLAAWTTQG